MHSYSNPTGIYRSAKRIGRTFSRCLNIYYQWQTFTDQLKRYIYIYILKKTFSCNLRAIFMLDLFQFYKELCNTKVCLISFAFKKYYLRGKLMGPSAFDKIPIL